LTLQRSLLSTKSAKSAKSPSSQQPAAQRRVPARVIDAEEEGARCQ
jgi:hypothetical protein